MRMDDPAARYAVAMPNLPDAFENVRVTCIANVYFDGGVVSHSIVLPDGSKKTLGLIHPGSYTFNTQSPERMEITAGECRVKLADADDWTHYAAGQAFDVPGDSRFEIAVDSGVAQYICSFG